MSYPRYSPILAWLFFCLLASPSAAQADNAIAEYQAIHQRLRAARANYEWSVSLASASDLNQLLNGSPNSLLEVARAKVHTDDLAGAFRDLEQFVRMGQATDLLASSPEFAPLRQKPEFGAIQTGMKENQSAVSLGTLVFRLSDPTLIPEDLDYDPNTKRFFITTVRGKKIITTDLAGTITEFAKAPDDWPLLAIKIDPSHGVAWASEVALTGFVFVPKADWGKSAVLGYDLKTGKLLHRIEGPQGSALGDMALTPDGDVIVSDGDGGGVYVIHAGGEGLERLDAGDFISPQTPGCPPGRQKDFCSRLLTRDRHVKCRNQTGSLVEYGGSVCVERDRRPVSRGSDFVGCPKWNLSRARRRLSTRSNMQSNSVRDDHRTFDRNPR
jgi:hypothetical protein